MHPSGLNLRLLDMANRIFVPMLKRLLLTVIAGLSFFLNEGLHSQDQPITEEVLARQRLLIEGNKYFLLEQYEEAQNAYNELIHQDQKNAAAIFGLSRVHLAKKDEDESLRLVNVAIKYEPDNLYFLQHKLDLLKRKKDNDKLVVVYQKMIELEPQREEFVYELSQCYDRLKDYKSAIETLETLKGGATEPAIGFRMARLYTKMGKEKKALEIYNGLVKTYPGETRYLHLLANHYRSSGENALAIDTYKKILEIDPDDHRAGLAIANGQRNSGSDLLYLQSIKSIISGPAIDVDVKVKELIPFVQKQAANRTTDVMNQLVDYAELLKELHPREAAVYALAGDLYHINDNRTLALENYEASLDLKKEVYTVWEQYLYLLLEDRNFDQILASSNEALDYFPNRGRINFFHGWALFENNEFAKAKSALEQARMMSGRDQLLQFEVNTLLAKVYFKTGQPSQAFDAFEKAMAINGENRELLANYAYHLALQEEQMDKARNMSEKAYKMSGGTSSANLAFAWVLAESGEIAQALVVIEEGLISGGQSSAEYLERYGDILFLNERKSDAVLQWQKALSLTGENKGLKEKIEKKALLK